jgi:hypothetical protein
MRQIFELRVAMNGALTYRLDESEGFWESWELIFDGQAFPGDWRLPKHIVKGGKGASLCDFILGYGSAPFVSKRAFEALSTELSCCAQFIPVGKILGADFYLMNVTQVCACLNKRESKISYSSDDPNRVLWLGKAVFRDEDLPKSPIFRVPEYPYFLFCTKDIAESVRRSALTGVGFVRADEETRIGGEKWAFPDLPLACKGQEYR